MKRIERMILNFFKVPEGERELILDNVGSEFSQPEVSKKGVAAWVMLNIYSESPALIFIGITAVIVALFVVSGNLFS